MLPNKWPLTHIQFDYRTPNSFAAAIQNNTSIVIVIVAGIFPASSRTGDIELVHAPREKRRDTFAQQQLNLCFFPLRRNIFTHLEKTIYSLTHPSLISYLSLAPRQASLRLSSLFFSIPHLSSLILIIVSIIRHGSATATDSSPRGHRLPALEPFNLALKTHQAVSRLPRPLQAQKGRH